MIGDRPPAFDTFTGEELMRLTWSDLDQLDALDGDGDEDREALALWWHLRRLQWAEEDAG